MALNTLKCNHLMALHFKGLRYVTLCDMFVARYVQQMFADDRLRSLQRVTTLLNLVV